MAMQEFLAVVSSYPTVVFTVLLAVAFVYWTLVIVGALGIDVLDVDLDGATHGATEGAAEGVVHGVAEGAAEGAAHGVAEGVAEGAAHGVAEGAAEAAGHGGAEAAMGSAGVVSSLFHALKLRQAPMTLVLSLVFFWSWFLSYLGTRLLLPAVGLDGGFFGGTLVLVLAFVAAFPLTSLVVRPLGRVLKVEAQTSRDDLVGKTVRVDTSRVDARFGTARFDDGGAGLILQVRCDGDNQLQRGDAALVLSYDEARSAYEVAPADDILPSRADERA